VNKVIFTGRIGNELDMQYSTSGKAFLKFNLAVSRIRKESGTDTDWFRCVAFGKTAELMNQYLSKGSKILVEGAMQTSNYEGRGGEKKYSVEVIVDRVEFLEKKKGEGEAQTAETENPITQEYVGEPLVANGNGEEIGEEIPF